jgi:hypothetical protein
MDSDLTNAQLHNNIVVNPELTSNASCLLFILHMALQKQFYAQEIMMLTISEKKFLTVMTERLKHIKTVYRH